MYSLDAIKVAADCVKAAGAILAEAAAEEPPATTTTIGEASTTSIGEVETDIPDGGSGPNVALLGAAALLVLLSGAALAFRASVDRR